MSENKETARTWFLHVDLDAFFASVEQLDHPEYRGKPVIVGGNPNEKRSVVSTASYEARKFGVHSAMPGFQAFRLCPQGIFVHPRMERYEELSYQIMQIFKDYSPDVEQMSIDEAFIDLTGTEKLFGPPWETAQKIKEQVKAETGLTVSLGLARTKYLAKIASGYKKPDGFYFIEPGLISEQNFMKGLPLNKVWGIGEKTLEILNKGGIYRTSDILERDYETLEFQFGKNTAGFLWDIMTAGGADVFKKERKSHSISAERTFPVDLNSSYAAETALMELSHEVLFRLLREESYSRTVMVKIRYNDFSTITVQKTCDTNILTLDSLFEVVKALFEKKYTEDKGIRLLGVGVENVTKEEKPLQQSLFDDGSKKKQAIEKAILKLEQRHPEIRVHKARTLKVLVSALLLWTCGKGQQIFSQTHTSVTEGGAGTILPDVFPSEVINKNPDTLYSWDLSDKTHVDFSLKGYWQGLFEGSLLWSFGSTDDAGQDSASQSFSPGMPVFKQAVDLTALVNLNDSWYFEASFADEFKKNTYAVSYKGKGYLREARLSNRKIFMQSQYSSDSFGYGLKGGDNQAPGLSLHFEDFLDGRWAADFILRYDMTKTKTATFYGMNSVTDQELLPSDFMRGSRFVFPETVKSLLPNIKDIYVQSDSGTYTDKNKKKYKKLSTADYLIIESQSQLVFSSSANTGRINGKVPEILVTFNSGEADQIINESGGFVSDIESLFDGYDMSKYLLSGINQLKSQIDGSPALVIQHPVKLTPYLCANYYDLGITKEADISVIYKNSEKEVKEYSIEEITETFSAVKDDFFAVNHKFARVTAASATGTSLQLAENRFPFAKDNPESYLNLKSGNDIVILVRSYSPVSEFLIGTAAAGGSVQVFKNGILDSGAKYNSDTGRVELSGSVGNTDKIYIIWQEDSSNYGSGSISSGAGFVYNFSEKVRADAALTASWPLSIQEKYSVQDNLKKGFAALSTGLQYKGENLSLTEELAGSLNTQNAAGSLLVSEQKNYVPEYYYLSSNAGYTTKAEPILNWEEAPAVPETLYQINNGTILKHGGESDSKGYKIPLAWDFSSIASGAWAAVDVKLSSVLVSANELEIKLTPDFTPESAGSYEVYLQLGVKAESEYSGEDSESISTWKLTGNDDAKTIKSLNLASRSPQYIRIRLYDEDRAKLSSNHDARLIVVQSASASPNDKNGKIYFGTYRPFLQSIYTQHSSDIYVNTTSEKITSPSADQLAKKENYTSIINWKYLAEAESFTNPDETKITALTYFEAADFSNYGQINFDFAYRMPDNLKSAAPSSSYTPSEKALTFLLENSSSSDSKAVKLVLHNLAPYISQDLSWNRLSINLTNREVRINGNILNTNDYEPLVINSKIIPSRLKVVFDTSSEGKLITEGSFYIDNLYYSDAALSLTAHHHTKVELKKEGEILNSYNKDGEKQLSIIKDATFTLDSSQTGSQAIVNKPKDTEKQGAMTSTAEGSVTITGVTLSADATISTSSNATDYTLFKNAGHSIKTDGESQKVLAFEESYRFNHDDKNLKKQNSLALDFSQLKLPLKISAEAKAQNSWSTQSQNSALSLDFKPWILGFTEKAEFTQKINTKKSASKTFNTNNYFEGWREISAFEFSTGEEYAIYKSEKYSSSAGLSLTAANLKPLLTYEIQGTSSTSNESTFSDAEAFKLELPFQLSSNNFKLTLSKAASGTENDSDINGTYFDDTKKLFSRQNKRAYLYKSLPFYDLFQQDLASSIQKEMDLSTQKLSYSTKYEGFWSRRLFNTPKDLIIPSSAAFAVSRDLTESSKRSDVYQYRLTLTSNSINNFGRESFHPIFLWYNQDEVISSLTGIVKIPASAPENTTYLAAWYAQLLFYIDNKNTLKTALDTSIETNLDYSAKATLIWQHQGKTTPIVEIAKLISKRVAETEFGITRKETVNFEISRAGKVKKQAYALSHLVEAKFLKYFTMSTGMGIDFNYYSNLPNTLAIKFSLGGKAEF
ncbi:Nucleotidyltransferase/DNA polymerase involved in DNA repair [Treponema sp. JC4]|uniref:DNA polymerase IV n=1 Tax=Treponema sp. JC4 TaxID=1124982 RepID=UPI00025B058F|nr:DNA polymerase IV [Treponema sp. JC4]EID84497.1 Nucleotidyltransferase/DNA polymerase involved in DNA repair [Treponema sp. JC4]